MNGYKKIIMLHDAVTNLPICLNTDNIGAFESKDIKIDDTSKKKTVIYFIHNMSNGDNEFSCTAVNESTEFIYQMIYGIKDKNKK